MKKRHILILLIILLICALAFFINGEKEPDLENIESLIGSKISQTDLSEDQAKNLTDRDFKEKDPLFYQDEGMNLLVFSKDYDLLYYDAIDFKENVDRKDIKKSSADDSDEFYEKLEKANLIPDNYFLYSEEDSFGEIKELTFYPKLNDDIENFYNRISVMFDKKSGRMIYFDRADDFLLEKDQVKPGISEAEASKFANDFRKRNNLPGDKGYHINLEVMSKEEFLDANKLKNVKYIDDGKYFLAYEVSYEDGQVIVLDANEGQVLETYYLDRKD